MRRKTGDGIPGGLEGGGDAGRHFRVAWALLAPLLAAGAGGASEIEDLRALERSVLRTVERAKPAFVFIRSQVQRQDAFGSLSAGSGFLVSADGYVLTNEHVVHGARRVQAQLADGRELTARVVGRDPQGDVALLKVEDDAPLPFLELGDSDALQVGQPVVALGDPFLVGSENMFLNFRGPPPGGEPSASLGVVSALHRFSDTYGDAVQVDLAVNRGNSGGPLLTLDGRVAGITGKIETRFLFGLNTGAGYAVPASQIRRFLEPLKAAGGGVVRHGTIPGLRVSARARDRGGLLVVGVAPESEAARSGFLKGDVLVSLGGFPVPTRGRYQGILSTYPAGWTLEAGVLRDGARIEFPVRLVDPEEPRSTPGGEPAGEAGPPGALFPGGSRR